MSAIQSPLESGIKKQFWEKGYYVAKGLFSSEDVAAWREECDRLVAMDELIHADNLRVGFRVSADGTRYIEKFDPLIDIAPVFNKLVADQRIINVLEEIYGDGAILFKDKLIFKWSGKSGYTMHQDAAFWQPFPMESLISVMVAIDGASEINGALEVFPGYHDKLMTPAGATRNMNAEEIGKIDASKGEIVETEPGDMIFFHSWTPHQSGPNRSEGSRRQLYLTYNAAKYGDLYDAHYEHYREYALAGKPEDVRNRAYFA